MRESGRQAGLSMWLFLFVTVVLLVVAIVGFRVLPAYIEYFSVRQALTQSMNESPDVLNIGALRSSFQRRADAGYIESVNSRDIDLHREGNFYVATIAWTRKLPLVANVYLLIEFETRAVR